MVTVAGVDSRPKFEVIALPAKAASLSGTPSLFRSSALSQATAVTVTASGQVCPAFAYTVLPGPLRPDGGPDIRNPNGLTTKVFELPETKVLAGGVGNW